MFPSHDQTATIGLFGPEGQIKFPAGFNYSNFFINSQNLVNKGIMTSTSGAGYDGTQNYFSSNNPPLYNAENYSKVAQEYISQMPSGKAKTYMQNQLAWFNYNNGVINQATRKPFSKPTQTISAPNDRDWETAAVTPTQTPTQTSTRTQSRTPTQTPTQTSTPTNTPTRTNTQTPTNTPTSTRTSTQTPTRS